MPATVDLIRNHYVSGLSTKAKDMEWYGRMGGDIVTLGGPGGFADHDQRHPYVNQCSPWWAGPWIEVIS